MSKSKKRKDNGDAAPEAREATPAAVPRLLKTGPVEQGIRRLRSLHVELVKLQQWVVHKGLKVCIVFEGRNGGRQGRHDQGDHRTRQPAWLCVVALPAPTEREKSQMHAQRYRGRPCGGRRCCYFVHAAGRAARASSA